MARKKYKTINDFARAIARAEGKKKQISIAQILEVLKIANQKLDGALYKLVKGQK